MKRTITIIILILFMIPVSNAEINWEFPDKIEAGSLYESSIRISNLEDKQMIIVGEFFPKGTIIVDYEIEGVYEEKTRSYIGEDEDYIVLQISAKEEYARIILDLIAPNQEENMNLNSELVYILSPSEYGTMNQVLNLTIPMQMEFPLGIYQDNDKSKLTQSQWLMLMSFLLLTTAVLVIKEESIHDNSLILYNKAKVKGRKYYSIAERKAKVLLEKTRNFSIQKGILKEKSTIKEKNSNSKVEKSQLKRRPLKKNVGKSSKKK